MKDSFNDRIQKASYVRCSVATPSGCLIRCLCGNVFNPGAEGVEEFCPECNRVFQPGFKYDVEVTSRRSGMALALLHGEEIGLDLDGMVLKAVEERFGPDYDGYCSWKVTHCDAAYFDLEREES